MFGIFEPLTDELETFLEENPELRAQLRSEIKAEMVGILGIPSSDALLNFNRCITMDRDLEGPDAIIRFSTSDLYKVAQLERLGEESKKILKTRVSNNVIELWFDRFDHWVLVE